MTVWPDKLIRSAIQTPPFPARAMVYTPEAYLGDYGGIQDSQVQPASLDVRLGPNFTVQFPDHDETLFIPAGGFLEMQPGACVLGHLLEAVSIPDDTIARVEGKSTWARKFLTVHSAGYIDPGFKGEITLELKNDGMFPLNLYPGQPIAQLSFQWLAAPALRPYGSDGLGSHYQHQVGPTKAVDWQ